MNITVSLKTKKKLLFAVNEVLLF